MEFGIFSNGFRPHTSAARTYEEDLYELVLADQLGFRDAWISEHHGEPVYVDKVDTCPVPEFMMCKAAALTKRIRMGAAIKVIHLMHPVDTAIQAATADHMIGGGRYMFGFGSGFPNPMFANERGLTFDDRHARLVEALDLVLKCWEANEPFDWDGKYWKGKNIVVLPKPLSRPHMPIGTATDTDSTLQLAGERGYTILSAQLDSVKGIRSKAERYGRAAKAAGRKNPLENVSVARFIYLTDSVKQAVDDLRPSVEHEMGFQRKRGLMRIIKSHLDLPDVAAEDIGFDHMLEKGLYCIGDPDTVTEQLRKFYDEAGGFGCLMMVTGKDWATREKRTRSMKLFMEQVAPKLRDLQPVIA